MNRIAVLVFAAFVFVLLGGAASAQSTVPTTLPPAGAVPNTPATAKAAANQFVSALRGQPGGCDTETRSGFLAKRASYLASCGTKDGTFQFFTIVSAANHVLKLNSPYLKAQLATFCATGHAISVGVRGLFINVYAGTGNGIDVVQQLATTAIGDFQNAKGYIAPIKLC